MGRELALGHLLAASPEALPPIEGWDDGWGAESGCGGEPSVAPATELGARRAEQAWRQERDAALGLSPASDAEALGARVDVITGEPTCVYGGACRSLACICHS